MNFLENGLKMSRNEWRIIGHKAGWIKSIKHRMAEKQSSFIKTADAGDVSDEQIRSAISDSLIWNYSKAFVLRDDDDSIINEVIAQQAIISAFYNLAMRDNEFSIKVRAYIENSRPFKLSVFFSKEGLTKYLVPTFDGVGISHLKSEFTALIPYQVSEPPKDVSVNTGAIKAKDAKSVEEIFEMANAAGFVTSRAKVAIGSVGAQRGTNWDTAYSLHITGVNAAILQKILAWFTDITNKDARNAYISPKKSTFDLTQRDEVYGLLSRLGLGDRYKDVVKSIKEYEDQKGLRQQLKKRGKIPNYKQNAKVEIITLADHDAEVFNHISNYITNNPQYVQMLSDAGIVDIQDELSYAFSEGAEGKILSKQEVQELTELAAA